MKPGEFLNTMAEKIGKKNDPRLTDFLSRADIQNMDIPDEVCNEIIGGLMSLEGAKNNLKVKNHFTASALNGVDSEIAEAVSQFGLDNSLFETEKDTYVKLRILKSKLKEAVDKKPEKNSEAEKEIAELKKAYNEVNRKMAETLDAHKAEKSSIEEKYNNQVLTFLKGNHLKGLNYADKDRPIDVQDKFAQLLIDEALAKRGAKVINDNGVLKLKSASDNSLEFYDESHKSLTYEDFVKKTLADSKILAVSDPNSKPGNTPQVPPFVQKEGEGGWQMNQKVADAYTAAIAPLQAAVQKA